MNIIQKVVRKISQDSGRVLETAYAAGARSYMEVRRKPKGSDYMVRPIDSRTGKGKGKWTFIEIKSGGATLTRLQKIMQKKFPKRYIVLRWVS